MPRNHLLWLAVGFEGGLAVVGWWLGRLFGVDVWPGAIPTAGVLAVGVLGTVPLLGGLVVVLHASWPPLARLREATYALIEWLFAHATLFDLVLVAALAGIGEELFFRGFLQTLLAEWVGLGLAIGVVGLLFGLAHAVTPAYAVYATLVGVYLGVLLPATGSLWAPVVAHAVYDLVALLLVRRRIHPPER